MKETSDTVLVLGRIFELEDPTLRTALHRLMYEMHDAQQRAATLGAQCGKRKLLRLAGLQRAAIEATFFDDDDRALDGMSLAARRYLARRTPVRSESAAKRRERIAAATVAALRNA